jgi:hypothetical protein
VAVDAHGPCLALYYLSTAEQTVLKAVGTRERGGGGAKMKQKRTTGEANKRRKPIVGFEPAPYISPRMHFRVSPVGHGPPAHACGHSAFIWHPLSSTRTTTQQLNSRPRSLVPNGLDGLNISGPPDGFVGRRNTGIWLQHMPTDSLRP